MIVVLLLLVHLVVAVPDNVQPRSAYAYSTRIEIRCFSLNSLVRLADGRDKRISDIDVGEKLLTWDGSQLVSTEFLLVLHRSSTDRTSFLDLRTRSDHRVTLTASHLLPVGHPNNRSVRFRLAKDVQLGEQLIVFHGNGTREFSPLSKKIVVIEEGFVAPLTDRGTLIVNGIYSSCFAHVHSHHLAQLVLFPVRVLYRLWKILQFPSDVNSFLRKEKKQSRV